MYENIHKGKKSIENSSPLCQTFTPIVTLKHTPQFGSSYRRQVFHPWPQTPQGEPDAKSETLLLIKLNICKSDIKRAHCVSSNPLLKMSVERTVQGSWINDAFDTILMEVFKFAVISRINFHPCASYIRSCPGKIGGNTRYTCRLSNLRPISLKEHLH